jgi:mannosyltransferase
MHRTPPRALGYWVVLVLIVLLAAATRILHITQQSLWIDEGITYFNITSPDLIDTLSRTDVHPPLYFMLLEGWLNIAGWSVLSMRMFSAFFGILCVALIVPLAKVINRDRTWFRHPSVPLLAALMLTLSDPDVVLAQDTRMYTLRSALLIISMIAYLRWMRTPSLARALWWIIPSVAALYTQYQSVYVLMVQGLHALFFLRGRVRIYAIGILALIGASFLPWALGVALPQRTNDFGVAAALASDWGTLVQFIYKYLSSQWALMLALLLFGCVAWVADKRLEWRLFGTTFILVTWLTLSLGISYILNLAYPVVLAPHRLLLISIPIALLIAQGLRNIRAPERWLLVAVITVFGLFVVDDYYPKEPFDQVAANVTRYAQPDDLALLEIFRGDNPVTYYIDYTTQHALEVESLRKWREYQSSEYPQGVIDRINGHDSIWFVHWSPDQSGFEFLAQSGHTRTATLTTQHYENTIAIYRYDRLPEGEVATFTNGMRIRHVEIIPEAMRIDLWWQTDAQQSLDYSISAFLLDANRQLVAQHDSFPFENRRPTSGWSTDEVIYDPHPLVPNTLPSGRYTVAVQVYTYFDGVRVPPADGSEWAIVGELVLGG